MKNNFLIIGLGSMGKRRIRCLRKISDEFIIYGYEINKGRANEVSKEYNIILITELKKIKNLKLHSILICTSPESHYDYIELALENKINVFIEAGVENFKHQNYIKESKFKNIIVAPSCTMLYHPAIKEIKRIKKNNLLGKFLNMTYCSGQYLPDWHPYEKVSDYYVSKKNTGGAREIVPFELTWITNIFGFPKNILGKVKKTTIIEGAEEIDDTYFITLNYKSSIISLNVDVVSRKATRFMIINFQNGQINWDWNNKYLKIYNSNSNTENIFEFNFSNHKGYNQNISEKMYVDEISDYLNLAENKQNNFENNLVNDFKIINILNQIEKKS